MKISLEGYISPHFKWKELLWLPKWETHCFPEEEVCENLIQFMHDKVEPVRAFLNMPMTIVSGYRPALYNELIQGRPFSQHRFGRAIDFTVKGKSADEVRLMLLPQLENFKIRMEKLTSSSWVHIDNGVVGKSGRYFIP